MTGPRTTDTDIEVSDLLDIEDDESGGPGAPHHRLRLYLGDDAADAEPKLAKAA